MALIETTSNGTQGQRRASKFDNLLRALREPHNVVQIMRARWQLRGCNTKPLSVRLRGRAFVENYGRIELGDRVRISGRTVPVELVSWPGGTLRVGSGTFLNYGSSLSAHEEVTIGKDCLIGNYVTIIDSDYHDLRDHTQQGRSAPIRIDDNVWLGTRAIVLKGVHIGQGSVIGAGSVVTTDIPPNSLAFGVPAKVVRRLDEGPATV